MSENMVAGSNALPTASRISAGLRPHRSEARPTKGVTRITTTAAIVDSHSDTSSLSDPAEVMKAGT